MKKMQKTTKLLALCLLAVGLFNACKKDPDDPGTGSKDPIALDCAKISDNFTFKNDPDRAVDYVVPCVINLEGDITVEAGTVIQFESEAGLEINGSLKAVGNAANPIIFEGRTAVPGAWKGLIFFSNDVNNRLDYVTIRHAGQEQFNSNGDKGNIVMWAQTRLSLTNSTISSGAEYGINCSYNEVNLTFENNVITNNAKAGVLIGSDEAHQLDAGSDYTGNGKDVIVVEARTITGNVSWEKLNVPYRIERNTADHMGIRAGNSLEILAGTRVEFEADMAIEVYDGSLKASGSASAPVVFTGATAAPGAWKGLYFDSNNLNNSLDYVEIAYAGSSSFDAPGEEATIMMWADSYLSVTNSTLRDGDGNCGISVQFPSGATLINTNNVFLNIPNDVCQ